MKDIRINHGFLDVHAIIVLYIAPNIQPVHWRVGVVYGGKWGRRRYRRRSVGNGAGALRPFDCAQDLRQAQDLREAPGDLSWGSRSGMREHSVPVADQYKPGTAREAAPLRWEGKVLRIVDEGTAWG